MAKVPHDLSKFHRRFGTGIVVIGTILGLFLLFLLGLLAWMHRGRRRQSQIDDRRNSLDLLEKGHLTMRERRDSKLNKIEENEETPDTDSNTVPIKADADVSATPVKTDTEEKYPIRPSSNEFSSSHDSSTKLDESPYEQPLPAVPVNEQSLLDNSTLQEEPTTIVSKEESEPTSAIRSAPTATSPITSNEEFFEMETQDSNGPDSPAKSPTTLTSDVPKTKSGWNY